MTHPSTASPRNSRRSLEAARVLGSSGARLFFRVGAPLARPAIAGGVALALMETLADYGTVSYFAVQTFTTGIYRAWFSLGDRTAAAQLAMVLLAFVIDRGYVYLQRAKLQAAVDADAYRARYGSGSRVDIARVRKHRPEPDLRERRPHFPIQIRTPAPIRRIGADRGQV
mgnify:CR=1 FL=1